MDIRLVLLPVIVVPLGFVTVLVAWQAWQVQRRLWSVRGWAQTSGRVIQSGVRETPVRVRRNTSVGSFRWAVRYAPEVVYEYQVAGYSYRGDRLQIGYGLASSGVRTAARYAERYPLHSEVTVYYQPDDPAESSLSLSAGCGLWAWWGLALFMVATTLFVALAVLGIFA
jgi:Protein of unknown function (DUF3592)